MSQLRVGPASPPGYPAAAAVAVLAIVGVPILLVPPSSDQVVDPSTVRRAAAGHRVVLALPDWRIETVQDHAEGGVLHYRSGSRSLRIDWMLGAGYRGRVASWVRREGRSTGVRVVGQESRLWSTGLADHLVVVPVEGGFFVEIRGTGMPQPVYLDLLGHLRRVDDAGFQASLPDSLVLPGRIDDTVHALLDDIEIPPGFDAGRLGLEGYREREEIGRVLTSELACAWVEEYERARRTGDDTAQQRAVSAMAASREWEVLRASPDDSWAALVGEVADAMAAGEPASALPGPGSGSCRPG